MAGIVGKGSAEVGVVCSVAVMEIISLQEDRLITIKWARENTGKDATIAREGVAAAPRLKLDSPRPIFPLGDASGDDRSGEAGPSRIEGRAEVLCVRWCAGRLLKRVFARARTARV